MATMPETGAVWPRNKVAVANANSRVLELQGMWFNHWAWNIRLAIELAKLIMLRLNAICCGLNFAFFRGQHCTVVATQVMKNASTALKFTTAVSRNGRLTDILPLIPGSLAFMREVAAAKASTAKAK